MTENDLQTTDSDPAWPWLVLSLISRIGYKMIRELVEHLGSVQELLKTQPEMLVSKFKLSAKLAGLIAKAT
jgi:ERCC4-type nuclease